MAKRRSTTAITRTVHIPSRTPAPIIRVAAPASPSRRRARRHVRRAVAGGKRLLGASQAQMIAVLGAGVLGLMQKNGVTLPKILPSLSTPANVGLLAFIGGKVLKSPTLDHAATGALSVALWAYLGGAPIQGDDVLGSAVVYDDTDVYAGNGYG